MKTIKLLLFTACIAGIYACNSSDQRNVTQDSTRADRTTPGPEKIVDEKLLVVPGKSVGEISLGEDMQNVGQNLGKPDAGDAAMGKAWGIWYSDDSTAGHRNELAIYSSYRDTSMVVKDVKQIRVTSNQFKTQDGFGTNRTLSDLTAKFPGLTRTAAYLNEAKDTVQIYDSKTEGIGFEFLKGKSISLTVYPKNLSNGTYLDAHPEWKRLN